MSYAPRIAPFYFMIAIALVTAPAASAQGRDSVTTTDAAATVTLKGIVRNPDGEALSGVEVTVDSTWSDVTNTAGEFTIAGVRPGIVELTARRVGYTPISTQVQADAGLIVQLAIKLVPAANELETVVVEGKRLNRTLVDNGFYQREKLGMGSFMNPEYLSQHRTGIASLLRMTPSIQMTRTRRGAELALGRNGNRLCLMSIYIDGIYFRAAGDMGVDDAINRDDLLAMEVYPRATQVPQKYLGSGNFNFDCGAILIWTKPFVPKKKK
ncbi:MAG TPA: carboxypeptidase regulatory-like domain-containing protein [Gemmatimonadaceae bacterium]